MEKKEVKKSVFEVLNAINVNEHTEKKGNLTYLSWAWAWAEVKKNYPEASYTIYENANGLNYHTDGKTCWVKTGVTVVDGDESLEHIEYLPVMDFKNRSIPADSVTSFDVNKAIQRSLTKACARHGLGLYIYAGEDLPEEETKAAESEPANKVKTLKNLMETAVAVYGKDMAPARFGALMEKAGCTRETMNEHYYDQIHAWMMEDRKGA